MILKKMEIAVFIFILSTSSLLADNNEVGQVIYGTYVNAKFHYEVKYPKGILIPQAEPIEKNGRTFASKGKQTILRVWGKDYDPKSTLNEEYQDELDSLTKANWKITSKILLIDQFGIAGVRDGKKLNRKGYLFFENEGHAILVLELEEPKGAKFNPIISACLKTLRMSKISGLTDDVFK